jgi:CheY-like chemotaxis protein
MNLAVNARDAMPTGGKLTVETRTVHVDEASASGLFTIPPGPYVLLAVTDTGTGMDVETMAHAFEPFFTTKGEGKGTGLGLATVYGIVKQSGGFVKVYSEVGRGTTFKVYLPCLQDSAHPEGTEQAAPSVPGGTETVLLVEDEEGVRALTQLLLRQCGYKVLAAAGGAQALELIAGHQGPLDILVTDVVMPGMGGPQLAEAVRLKYPGVKVLFLSGYTDDAVFRHGVLESETAFLQKPFTISALANKLREVLDAPRG